jgi:hypothetical protein
MFFSCLAGPDQETMVEEEYHDHATVLVKLSYCQVDDVHDHDQRPNDPRRDISLEFSRIDMEV